MIPEYFWALGGAVCIVALLITIRVGTRNVEEFSDSDEAAEQKEGL